MKYCISTLSALAIATSLSFAQEKPAAPGGAGGAGGGKQRPNPEEIFKKLDTNTDGALSLDEFKASPRAQKDPTKAEANYKKIDADSDGKVTPEEFKANFGKHQGGKGGPGAKGGQGGHQGKGGKGGAAPAPAPAPAPAGQ